MESNQKETLNIKEKKQIETTQKEFNRILDQAHQLSGQIKNESTYKIAADFLLAIRGRLKWWLEFNKPIKQAMDKAKKLVLDRERLIADPLIRAGEEFLVPAMLRFTKEQERLRREAEAKIQAELKKQQEEANLKQAAALEKEGKKEEAEQALNAPVYDAPVVLQKTEKVKGIGSSKNWKFQVYDADKVPRQFLMVDEKAIGQIVRALKEKANIPGVKIWSEDGIRVGGR